MEHAVAIVGMACRFPGANSLSDFWSLLSEGRESVGEIPPQRFDAGSLYDARPGTSGKIYCRRGGFIDDIELFDNALFNVSPREAVRMDPQQRLLLQLAWEALDDAGWSNEGTNGGRSGIFVGVHANDYTECVLDPELLDVHATTGTDRSFLAGRVGFAFGFEGPCFTLDTACASSLSAVHLALQSLRSGECRLALAAGVNLLLRPRGFVSLCQGGLLALDGRCKFGDDTADGFVRSEGAGVVVLKRLADAVVDGDRIHAVIRGSAVSSNGARSQTLMTPNVEAYRELLLRAFADARVQPGDLDYIEVHGAATRVGDPLEIQGVGEAIGDSRRGRGPCALGSVKTNIGHTEAASGMAGLIKVALALRHGVLPASLHCSTPNRAVPWEELPVRVQTRTEPWPREAAGPRVAGVSAYGLSGSNAHVVLQAPPAAAEKMGAAEALDDLGVLTLSAATPGALRAAAQRFFDFLPAAAASFRDVCYSASARRRHHTERLALSARSAAEAASLLAGFLAGESNAGLSVGKADRVREPVFVFSGHGSQWKGMGEQLLHEPPARAALLACEEALRPHVGWSLIEELTRPGPSFRSDKLDFVQPAIFSLQVAIAALWRSWGVQPRAVVGHSMGEVAAAHVAGALSLEDAARIISLRSAIMLRAPGDTAMAVVDLPFGRAEELVRPFSDRVAVAVESSAESCVLSGERALVEQVLSPLRDAGVFCRYVKVDVAGHSPQLRAVIPEMRAAIGKVAPRSGGVPYYSAVTGTAVEAEALDERYWIRNVIDPVRFWTVISRLCDDGADSFLEISPHPITLTSLRQGFAQSGRDVLTTGSLVREQDERAAMRRSLGQLYTRGHRVDWRAVYPAGSKVVSLPAYPFEGRRFWAESPARSSRRLGGGSASALLGEHVRLAGARKLHVFESLLTSFAPACLEGHRFQGEVLLSGSAYVEMVLAAGRVVLGELAELHHLVLSAPLVLSDSPRKIQVLLEETGDGAKVQVFSAADEAGGEWSLHAEVGLRRREGGAPVDARALEPAAANTELDRAAHYARLAARGLELSGDYAAVSRVTVTAAYAAGELRLPRELRSDAALFVVHPALLDACFQVSAHALPDSDGVWLASGIERLELSRPLAGDETVIARATLEGSSANVELEAQNSAGEVVLRVSGLRLRHLQAAASRGGAALSLAVRLQRADGEERSRVALEGVSAIVAQVLGQRRDELALDVALNRLGLDSLMAVELRRRLEREAATPVSTVKLLQGPTVSELTTLVLRQAEQSLEGSAGASDGNTTAIRAQEPAGETGGATQPLSWNQRALAFIYELARDSAAYHYGFTARAPSGIDVAALKTAIAAVVERHTSLRSAFVSRDGELWARVLPATELELELDVVEAAGFSELELRAALARAFHEPFDLARPPLRFGLWRCGAAGDVFSFTLHHIIIDFTSVVVLLEELSRVYEAALAGEAVQLPRVTADYAEFVRWQAEILNDGRGRSYRDYWTRTLSGAASFALATDRPRPSVQTYRGASSTRPLPGSLVERLQRLALAAGTTLHTVLLTGFVANLQRYTGESDIVVGTYSSGRSEAKFERTVGDLVNPLPIRVECSGCPSFSALLGRTRDAMLGALEHGDYPLPLIIEALRLPRDASRSPLFQTVFVLQQAGSMPELHPFTDGRAGGRLQLGALELESIEVPQAKARFELELMVLAEASGQYSILAQYNTELFDAASIQRWIAAYLTLLEGAVDDSESMLDAIPAVSQQDWTALQATLNATRSEYPEATVPELFEAAAREFGRKPALWDAKGELTYEELAARVRQFARQLGASGVGRGSRVGILLERSRDLVMALMAVLRVGASYVPLDPWHPQERNALILDDAEVGFVITSAALALPEKVRDSGAVVLTVDDPEMVAAGPDTAPSRAELEDDAYLLYTSGSTGRPKGVRISHRSLTNLLWSMRALPGMTSDDTLLSVTTVSFDIAALELFLPLLSGGKLALAPRAATVDGVALAALLADTRATMLQATPVTYRLLLEAGWRGRPDFKILCGGEALPPDLAAALVERGRVFNLYGPTETTIWSLVHQVEAARPGASVPIGKPIANTEVYVVDGQMQPAPPGAIGELLIAGAGVAKGYHRRPDLTAERFVKPAWLGGERAYRTGDRVRLRGDGVLEFLGRGDTQIKIRGYRVELGEIDAALCTHPAVRDAVTVLRDGPAGIAELVAYVVLNATFDEAELRAHLRRALPEYMVPAWIQELAELPRTPNNKVDRKALPAVNRASGTPASEELAPRSETEALVAKIWEELLGRRAFSVDANFFDLGGSSFLIARVRARIAEQTGRDVPLVEMYQYATVRALAQRLSDTPDPGRRTALARQRALQQRAALAAATRRHS